MQAPLLQHPSTSATTSAPGSPRRSLPWAAPVWSAAGAWSDRQQMLHDIFDNTSTAAQATPVTRCAVNWMPTQPRNEAYPRARSFARTRIHFSRRASLASGERNFDRGESPWRGLVAGDEPGVILAMRAQICLIYSGFHLVCVTNVLSLRIYARRGMTWVTMRGEVVDQRLCRLRWSAHHSASRVAGLHIRACRVV